MDKSHDMDEISRLAKRFHALLDKVQGILDEMHTESSLEAEGGTPVLPRSGSGRKAYTIHAANARDEGRQKALIKVIDNALNQIDVAVSTGVGDGGGESGRRRLFQSGKTLFTLEELHFLEQKLRTFQPVPAGESHPDR